MKSEKTNWDEIAPGARGEEREAGPNEGEKARVGDDERARIFPRCEAGWGKIRAQFPNPFAPVEFVPPKLELPRFEPPEPMLAPLLEPVMVERPAFEPLA